MADRKTVDQRNQLYPQFIRGIPPNNEMAKVEDRQEEGRQEEGRPRFGQRSMPDERFLEQLTGSQTMHPHLPREQDIEAMELSGRQRAATATAEGDATLGRLAAGLMGNEAQGLDFPSLRLPEDVLGELQQAPAIDLSSYVQALNDSL